jgi:hypothetical protein
LTVCARLRPSIDVARTHCEALASAGRTSQALSVAEALTKVESTSVQAWLLLADVTHACLLDTKDTHGSAVGLAVVAVLERGIRACSPSFAMGDPARKAELELLWRRKVDARLALGAGNPQAVLDDLKVSALTASVLFAPCVTCLWRASQAASALGMLVHEQSLWASLCKQAE